MSDDLNQTNLFLRSILGNLRVAVVVLDSNLLIRVWNRHAEDLWGLRAAEVRNKNVFSLDIGLPIEQFRREILASLSGEQELTTRTVAATNRRGKAVQVQVTCTPLTGSDHIEGVILVVDEAQP